MGRPALIALILATAAVWVASGCAGSADESAPTPTTALDLATTIDPESGATAEGPESSDEGVRPRAMGVFVPPPTLVPPRSETPSTLGAEPDDDGAPDSSEGDSESADGSQQRLPRQLEVGDCVNLGNWDDPASSEHDSLAVVTCNDPHDAEVFARVSLNEDADAPYPDDHHVAAAADRVCFEQFEGYVGMRYVDARLEIVHLRPPRAAWIRGDRSVVCMLVNSNLEPLVGSMAADR